MGGSGNTPVYCKPPFLWEGILLTWSQVSGRGLQWSQEPCHVATALNLALGSLAVGQPRAEGDRTPRFACSMRPLSSIFSQELGTIQRNLTFQLEDGGCFKAAGKSHVSPWLGWFGAGNSIVYSLPTPLLHKCCPGGQTTNTLRPQGACSPCSCLRVWRWFACPSSCGPVTLGRGQPLTPALEEGELKSFCLLTANYPEVLSGPRAEC